LGMKYTRIEKQWIKSIPKHLMPSKEEIEKIIKGARKRRKAAKTEWKWQ